MRRPNSPRELPLHALASAFRLFRRILLRLVATVDRVDRRARSLMIRKEAFPASPSSLKTGILITTFKQRQFNCCLPLVRQLRQNGIELPITVIINGNLGSRHDPAERSRFIKELSDLPDVNIVGMGSITSLSRMWNLGIQVGNFDVTIVLNDDLAVLGRVVTDDLEKLVAAASSHQLALGGIG